MFQTVLYQKLARLRAEQNKAQTSGDDAFKDLDDLLGGTKSAIEPEEQPFYNSQYEKYKPALAKAFESIEQTGTFQDRVDAFIDKLHERYSLERLETLEPYLARFVDDHVPDNEQKESVNTDDSSTASSDRRGEDAGEDGSVPSGTESPTVLDDVLPELPVPAGASEDSGGADTAGHVLHDVRPPDRRGNRPANGEAASGEGSDISTPGRRGVKTGAKTKSKSPNPGDAKRVVGSTGNYYVDDVDAFASGGLKTKFRSNIDAIKTLRLIQSEGRTTATPEEQAKLAKYIGWGQFPALFNIYNDKGKSWEKEREELLGLISKDEFQAASAYIQED